MYSNSIRLDNQAFPYSRSAPVGRHPTRAKVCRLEERRSAFRSLETTSGREAVGGDNSPMLILESRETRGELYEPKCSRHGSSDYSNRIGGGMAHVPFFISKFRCVCVCSARGRKQFGSLRRRVRFSSASCAYFYAEKILFLF